MNKIYIHKHLYPALDVNTLSYFVYLSQKFKHKHFKRFQSGLNRNTEYKVCKSLIKADLMTFKDGLYKIVSNRQINSKYTIEKHKSTTFKNSRNFTKQFKIFTSLTDLNEIKYFLKSLPTLNNLCKQQRQIERKTYFSNLKRKLDKGFGSLLEHKKLEKYRLKNNLEANYLQLSIKGMARINNVSNVTAIKYRKRLVDVGLIKTKRVNKVLKTNATNLDLKLARLITPYVKLFKGSLVIDETTKFSISF